jgi:hypothetical protein
MILENSKLYYGNSALLNKLKYYPVLIAYYCISALVYYFCSTKIATQTLGRMAKETAHQIGTPLSSLIGWVEILKSKMLMNQQRLRLKRY